MDSGARKWLAGFFLAGVGLGAWLLAGLDSGVAKTFSPVFLVVIPLLVTFLGAGLRTLFGSRLHPLVSARRRFGRATEDALVVAWLSGTSLLAGVGCAALVPERLLLVRLLLGLAIPFVGGIAAFTGFGTRWTPGSRLATALNWSMVMPALLLSGWYAATYAAIYVCVRYLGLTELGPWIPITIFLCFAAALAVAVVISRSIHARITGDALLFRFEKDGGAKSWRQISVILARAGFKQSSGAWVGPLGRGEACVNERRGRIQVQVSGFRPDVTLRAGVPGPKSTLDTGDEAFDGQIAVAGDAAACFAAFTPQAREKLLRVLDRFPSLHLADGHLVAEGEVAAPRFLEALRELAAACDALGDPGNEGERVLRILRTDPSPRVRARALDFLLTESVTVPEAAAREALSDLPGPEVTLAAAFQLGEDGGPHLERLLGPASSQLLRAKALDAIAARCNDVTWAAAAARGLADPEANIRLGVVRAMSDRWLPPFEELAIRASNDLDARVRAAAISLFASRGLGAHQASLYPRLADLDYTVKKAAIDVLGAIATPDAIEKLVAVRNAGGELGRLADGAIKEIQSRMPGGAHGQLSIIEDEAAGRLSPATEGGSLAIAQAPTGSVSLGPDEKTPAPIETEKITDPVPAALAQAAARKVPG